MPVCSHPSPKRGGCAAGSPPHPLRSHGGDGPAGPGETAPPPPLPPWPGGDVMVGEGRGGGGDPAPPFLSPSSSSPPPQRQPRRGGPGAGWGRRGGFYRAIPTPGGGPSVCLSVRVRGSASSWVRASPPRPRGDGPGCSPPGGRGEHGGAVGGLKAVGG